MTWLMENPIPILVIGGLLVAILAGGWIQTGQKWLIGAAVAALALTVGLLVLERWVVTEREHIRQTLYQIAADVERNDLEALLAHIHPSAREVRQQAAGEMPKYQFEQVKIKRNLEITVYAERQPPQAVAQFNVVVVASDRRGLIQDRHVPRFVEVTFHKQQGPDGDHWRVTHYQHQDARLGFTTRH